DEVGARVDRNGYLSARWSLLPAGNRCRQRRHSHHARQLRKLLYRRAAPCCPAAGATGVRALVLLSAHMGGKDLFRTISEAGLMAGKHFDEVSARARELVAAGARSELMQVPGWWWIISAQTFVDYLDVCPDILELAPQVRCCSCAAIARRSMSMPATGDPA